MAAPDILVERVDALKSSDLHDLCDAADEAIRAGGGFGWIAPPAREVMERFWKGVLVVPERSLFIGRLDGIVAGSAQLVKTPRNNEAQAHSGTLTTAFVAPWARGYGLARRLTVAVEAAAREQGLRVLNLDLRATQEVAIALYENLGFRRWGTHPFYAFIDGQPVAGLFYYKDLTETSLPDETTP